MPKKYCYVFLCLALLNHIPASAAEKNHTVTLTQGWVRETPPSTPNAAAFLTLQNASAAPKYITAIQCSDAAARCELHEHLHTENGGMRMQQVTSPLAVPANGALVFAPGGYHIMLFDIKKSLRAGETVTLTFVFDDQSQLTVQLPVKSIRAE